MSKKKLTARERRKFELAEQCQAGMRAGREEIVRELWTLLNFDEKLDKLEDRILRRVLYEDSE